MRNRRRGRRRQSGYVSLRTLIGLLITLSILPLAIRGMTFAANLKFKYTEISDEIALYQLRRILLISYDLENYGDSLEFLYQNDNYSLSLINERLVLQPGYQMFLDDIDNLYFYEEGNVIYIVYTKENKEFKTPISKRNGIHLDDFLDDDDELYESDSYDE